MKHILSQLRPVLPFLTQRATALAALSGAVALNALAASAGPVPERDWPQWRGPLANGVAPGARPPTEWSETRNVKWKVRIPGSGTSTPILWEDQVFILTAVPSGPPPEGARAPSGGGRGQVEEPTETHAFMVVSYDRNTGRERWKSVARTEFPHESHHRDHGYASFSPITDGESLYVFLGSRGLHAYDLEGHRRWERDLGRMQTRNGFGEGSSPALWGEVLVVNWDHEGDDFIAAFNKRTGEELWRRPRSEPTSWATPLILEHQGQVQVVVNATERIRSYELHSGRLIWEAGGMTVNVIPSPVSGFGKVFALSGFRGSALRAIRLGQTGDLTGTDAVAWSYDRNTPYVPSPLLAGERLYFLAGNNATLSILGARDGRILVDAERLPGLFGAYASPVAADGRVIVLGRNGTSVVLREGNTLEILATNVLDDGFDASPAAVGNQLFLRGRQFLYCLEEG
ncbi:MAG: PQQ-binding-like beta-propeller repeat protein [Verrucomicrobiae bacterium]|nr:PQQ-binding-like beta-propeller repeat protein [Verrucomicrobiae bacterium]